jgi:hypothetical protein
MHEATLLLRPTILPNDHDRDQGRRSEIIVVLGDLFLLQGRGRLDEGSIAFELPHVEHGRTNRRELLRSDRRLIFGREPHPYEPLVGWNLILITAAREATQNKEAGEHSNWGIDGHGMSVSNSKSCVSGAPTVADPMIEAQHARKLREGPPPFIEPLLQSYRGFWTSGSG